MSIDKKVHFATSDCPITEWRGTVKAVCGAEVVQAIRQFTWDDVPTGQRGEWSKIIDCQECIAGLETLPPFALFLYSVKSALAFKPEKREEVIFGN